MHNQSNIRNIGIFAHVDAGKTTLTERLLARAGAIRAAGSVDSRTAHTDRLDVERRRGISVRSTCAPLEWNGVYINLIDTPGHADFASEVERSMWALDGAVLLLSAVEGVQPRAEVLFRAFEAARLPLLIFVNKTDREGADAQRTIMDARASLSPKIVDYASDDQLHACLAETDEIALADYVSGRVYPREALLRSLKPLVAECATYPVFSGSALRDEGVEALLHAMADLLPQPEGDENADAAGIVFAVSQDRALGRCAHVRMASGAIRNRDPVALDGGEVKITQIRTIPLEGRGSDVGVLRAGEIGAESFHCLCIPYSNVVFGAGHFRETRNGAFMEAFINIALSLILVRPFGLVGVAIGTLCANLFRTMQYAHYMSRNIIRRPYFAFIKRMIIYAVNAAVIILVLRMLPDKAYHSYWEWIVRALIAFPIAAGITLLTGIVAYREDAMGLWKLGRALIKRR